MNRTPADFSGSQEMHSLGKRGDLNCLGGSRVGDVFSYAPHSQVHTQTDGDLMDEQANEQALLDLMVTIVAADRGIRRSCLSTEQVIKSQILTREETLRRAFLKHVTRLRDGERPIGVCVFIASPLSGKGACPDNTVSMLCRQHPAPVSNFRKLILGKRREEEDGDGIEICLGDVFGEEERAARLPWAGDSVSIIKFPETVGCDRARYYARIETTTPCSIEGRNVYVMLKAEDGSMARAKLTPSKPHSVLEGDTLPDNWDAVFLGLAVD